MMRPLRALLSWCATRISVWARDVRMSLNLVLGLLALVGVLLAALLTPTVAWMLQRASRPSEGEKRIVDPPPPDSPECSLPASLRSEDGFQDCPTWVYTCTQGECGRAEWIDRFFLPDPEDKVAGWRRLCDVVILRNGTCPDPMSHLSVLRTASNPSW